MRHFRPGGPPGCPRPRRAAGKAARGTGRLREGARSEQSVRRRRGGTALTAFRRFPVSLCAEGEGALSRQRRKMAADSEVSVSPSPPLRSPLGSRRSPLSLLLSLSPRSPSRRCLRSRTSPPPPSGRGRWCCRRRRSRSPHRGRDGGGCAVSAPARSSCRGEPGLAGREAALAGTRWQPEPCPGVTGASVRRGLRPQVMSWLRGSSQAVSQLSERSGLISVCQGIRIKAYVFFK